MKISKKKKISARFVMKLTKDYEFTETTPVPDSILSLFSSLPIKIALVNESRNLVSVDERNVHPRYCNFCHLTGTFFLDSKKWKKKNKKNYCKKYIARGRQNNRVKSLRKFKKTKQTNASEWNLYNLNEPFSKYFILNLEFCTPWIFYETEWDCVVVFRWKFY